jgi:hypothetical protein
MAVLPFPFQVAREWGRRHEPAHFVAVARIISLSVRRKAAERERRDQGGDGGDPPRRRPQGGPVS